MEPSIQEEEFTPVTYKKVRAPKKRKGREKPRERSLVERLALRRDLLQQSGFLKQCQDLLRDSLLPLGIVSSIGHAVCLGLGSLGDSTKSQDQYILFEALIDELQISSPVFDRKSTTIYDPAFTKEDEEFFEDRDMRVLSDEHSLTFGSTTLLFMPHCPRDLFEQLIQKNWSLEGLERLIICGNRLDAYDDPTHPSASAKAKTPFILKSLSLWSSIALPPFKHDLYVFNDVSIQWAPKTILSVQAREFWEPFQFEDDHEKPAREMFAG